MLYIYGYAICMLRKFILMYFVYPYFCSVENDNLGFANRKHNVGSILSFSGLYLDFGRLTTLKLTESALLLFAYSRKLKKKHDVSHQVL